jgi:hypothetical protein
MEHHRCFRVYVTQTRATRISNTVIFKHQYITNPTISPESHVVAAAQQLAMALKGNIPVGNETAEALKKVSELLIKIARVKQEATKAKEQRNKIRANPTAHITMHLPRVTIPHPRVNVPAPRVDKPPQGHIVANPPMPRPVEQSPATCSQSRSPQFDEQSPMAQPNYISQDKEDANNSPPSVKQPDQPHGT